MSQPSRAVAFDLDTASLSSLQEALPAWEIAVVHGATAASLTRGWNPGTADLLVVKAREDMGETLGLCRFLGYCTDFSPDCREAPASDLGFHAERQYQPPRVDAPLLLLVSPGQETIVRAALEAGAHCCLTLPIHHKDVAAMLANARSGNQPGRHTRSLERPQTEDRWRDEGGQG